MSPHWLSKQKQVLPAEDTLDQIEYRFVSTVSTSDFGELKPKSISEEVAQRLLLLTDSLCLASYCALMSFLFPQSALSIFSANIVLFSVLAMMGHFYSLERNYYALGKLLPVAALFLSAQAWLLPEGNARYVALLAGIAMFALMAVAHHFISRPYANPRAEGASRYIEMKMKRAVDIMIAGSTLIGVAPLWVAAALLIWLEAPKEPVLYVQSRYGLDRSVFSIFKFRTMVPNAEKLISEAYQSKSGSLYKKKEDSRITAFGRILRNTSIDELPQLINILKGDMSVVGPRPFMLVEQDKMPEWQQKIRSRYKPGLTCLWQINGRVKGLRDFNSIGRDDADYINNWCLMNDLIIILKTFPVVFLQQGGY